MGLDIDFCSDGRDILYLRNHREFLELFLKQNGQLVQPGYSDFCVDMRVLNGVADELCAELRKHGLTEADLPEDVPVNFWDLDARTTPWEVLLPVYPLLVRILRRAVYERGPIICGWSS